MPVTALVITFAPNLSGGTITLSNTLTINTNLTIDASALPDGIQINGNYAVQILTVASNTLVYLNSLSITNGYGASGGGIENNGTLTLTNCTFGKLCDEHLCRRRRHTTMAV